MSYIEREKIDQYWNDASGTVIINGSSSSNTSSSTNTDWSAENLARWDWLISGWSKMDFKERMTIFMPYLHYVNVRDFFKRDFDKAFEHEMIETAYKTCRVFKDFRFDPDQQGTPLLIMVYHPIDVSNIPDATVRADVRDWGQRYGFLKCDCQSCRRTS